MIISTTFNGSAEISTSLIPQRYLTNAGEPYLTSLGEYYMAAGDSVPSSMIKIGGGSASANFDEFFQCTGGGTAALRIESSVPFLSVNFAASVNLLLESYSGSVELIDGVGVLTQETAVTSLVVKITGLNTGDRIYVSRPAEAIEYPYSPQAGMLLTRYSTSRIEYAGGKSIYPANHIHQQSSLPVSTQLPNLNRPDAESISEHFDNADGACIIDGMYIFNLDWIMKAHAKTRGLINCSITGRVFKPYD